MRSLSANSEASGELSEWLKEHAWKVCVRQRTESSNLSLTAIFSTEKVRGKPAILINKGVAGFFVSVGCVFCFQVAEHPSLKACATWSPVNTTEVKQAWKISLSA